VTPPQLIVIQLNRQFRLLAARVVDAKTLNYAALRL
jgi:hypothetical protein